jgi:heme/copper-type cytochrome/quinol oxidase subunit 2
MHGLMNGWNWIWMSLMIVTWAIVIGVLVYVAVRLATHPPDRKEHL